MYLLVYKVIGLSPHSVVKDVQDIRKMFVASQLKGEYLVTESDHDR